MPDGVLRLARAFRTAARGCNGNRRARIAAQRRLVGLHRFRPAIHVIEQDAEVVEQHRVVAARLDRRAIDALGIREMPGVVQKAPAVDVGIDERRIGVDRVHVRLQRGATSCASSADTSLEPRLRVGRVVRVALDDAERAIGGIAVELEQVLAGFRLPAARALAHDDAVGHGADAQARTAASIRAGDGAARATSA